MYYFPPKLYLSLLLVLLAVQVCVAQAGTDTLVAEADSIVPTRSLGDSINTQLPDTASRQADTLQMVLTPPKAEPDTLLQAFYRLNPYVDVYRTIVFRNEDPFTTPNKDMFFYVITGLLLFLGAIRLLFSKYLSDVFRIFFQSNFRQKSIREQLLQNRTASLTFNVFFCVSTGFFLYFVADYKGWLPEEGFLKTALLCVALVAIVYTTKYLALQVSGWLFGMADVTDTYLFIVFLINKIVGIILLPAILILALGSTALQPVILMVSLIILAIIYLYRYMIALPLVRNRSGLTGFHFFIYLCAFEVVPVLIIYKLLLIVLSR